MKCGKCGFQHDESKNILIKVLEKKESLGGILATNDKVNLAEETGISIQMMNRYVKVAEKYENEINSHNFEFIENSSFNKVYEALKGKTDWRKDAYKKLLKDMPSLKYADFLEFTKKNK